MWREGGHSAGHPPLQSGNNCVLWFLPINTEVYDWVRLRPPKKDSELFVWWIPATENMLKGPAGRGVFIAL